MENLKKIRKLYGYTQSDIAKLLNISMHTYSKYELGKINISPDTIVFLANLFNCTTDYLLDRTTLTNSIKTFEWSVNKMKEAASKDDDISLEMNWGDHLRSEEVEKVRKLLKKVGMIDDFDWN
jgi:transcriptional regulator with XRE-family HTH domain